jgi:hypothetical protein
MNYLDFTAEETNLIAIYKKDTRIATFAAIKDAIAHMDAPMQQIAVRAGAKLANMTDSEFGVVAFAPDDDPDDAA